MVMTASGYCFTFVEYCSKSMECSARTKVLEICVSQNLTKLRNRANIRNKRRKAKKKGERKKETCPSRESNRVMHARDVQNYATMSQEIKLSRLAKVFVFSVDILPGKAA